MPRWPGPSAPVQVQSHPADLGLVSPAAELDAARRRGRPFAHLAWPASSAGRHAVCLLPHGTADRARDWRGPLVSNSHVLAGLIPGAKLTLYPDAGHAFLFQDQAAFLP